MIITRTPVRISLLGGGTDYPDHFRQHGGQTLGAAIDKYSYITVNHLAGLFDYSIRVSYSRTELAKAVGEIAHPVVRESLRLLGIEGGIEIHYIGDLPARAGLGSSSSFTVGLLHALHAFKGDMVGPSQLAAEAVHLECERLGERVGVQDQYTCAHGGLLHLTFGRDGDVAVAPLALRTGRLAELEAHLMLVYTGLRRHAHEVLAEQVERTRSGANADELARLNDLVTEGLGILGGADPIARLGETLHAAWEIKRRLSSQITNPVIDAYYERARAAGALGGKLLGAGSGGFLLFFVAPGRRAAVRAALAELNTVPFAFEHGGSRILFYQPR